MKPNELIDIEKKEEIVANNTIGKSLLKVEQSHGSQETQESPDKGGNQPKIGGD